MARRHLDEDGYLDEERGEFVFPDVNVVIDKAARIIGAIDLIGGRLYIEPRREEVAPDRFETVGWSIVVDSFAPAERIARKPRKDHDEQPEPEAEPVGAEA